MSNVQAEITPDGRVRLTGDPDGLARLLSNLGYGGNQVSLHLGAGDATSKETPEASEGEGEEDEADHPMLDEIPDAEEVTLFLEQCEHHELPFAHTIRDVAEAFLGRHVPQSESKRVYDRIYRRAKRAREKIKERHGGEWRSKLVTPSNGQGGAPRKLYFLASPESSLDRIFEKPE